MKKLVHPSGKEVTKGDKVVSFRGEFYYVESWEEPKGEGKSGYVWVSEFPSLENATNYYTSVFRLAWKETITH